MSNEWKQLTAEEAGDLIACLPAEWPKESDDVSIEQTTKQLEEWEDIDEKILETLAYSTHWKVRRAVALSPSCSSEFIDRLKHKKIKVFWGLEPDEIILQAICDRSLPPEWQALYSPRGQIKDTDLLIERVKSGEAPITVLEALSQHQYPSVVEAVVRAPGVTQTILDQIQQRCVEAEPAYRFADVLTAIREISGEGSNNNHSSDSPSQILRSKELIGSLGRDYLDLLFNALAVAGVEDVISRDQSEVWSLLGENEPQEYDYFADSHSEIIERATILLSQELDEAFQSSHEQFDSLLQDNRGYLRFWEKFADEEINVDIDSFSEALDQILEDIS